MSGLGDVAHRVKRDDERARRVRAKYRKKRFVLGGELHDTIKADGSRNKKTRQVHKHRTKRRMERDGVTLEKELAYRFDPPHPPQPQGLENCPKLMPAFTTLDSSSGLPVQSSELVRAVHPEGHRGKDKTPGATIVRGLRERGLNVVSTWGNTESMCTPTPCDESAVIDKSAWIKPEKPQRSTPSLPVVQFLNRPLFDRST